MIDNLVIGNFAIGNFVIDNRTLVRVVYSNERSGQSTFHIRVVEPLGATEPARNATV